MIGCDTASRYHTSSFRVSSKKKENQTHSRDIIHTHTFTISLSLLVRTVVCAPASSTHTRTGPISRVHFVLIENPSTHPSHPSSFLTPVLVPLLSPVESRIRLRRIRNNDKRNTCTVLFKIKQTQKKKTVQTICPIAIQVNKFKFQVLHRWPCMVAIRRVMSQTKCVCVDRNVGCVFAARCLSVSEIVREKSCACVCVRLIIILILILG